MQPFVRTYAMVVSVLSLPLAVSSCVKQGAPSASKEVPITQIGDRAGDRAASMTSVGVPSGVKLKGGLIRTQSIAPGSTTLTTADSTMLTSTEATQANQNYQQKVASGAITSQSLLDPYDSVHAKVWAISRIKYKWWFVGRNDVIRFDKSMVRRNSTNVNDKFPVSFYVVPNAVWDSYGNSGYAAYAFGTDYGCELYFKQDYAPRDAKTINAYGSAKYRSTLDNGSNDSSNQTYWTIAFDVLAHEMGHCMDYMANGNFLFGIPIGANHSGFTRTDLAAQQYGTYFGDPYEAYAQVFSENFKFKCGAYNIDMVRDEAFANRLSSSHGCATLSQYYYDFQVRDYIYNVITQNNQPALVRVSNARPAVTATSQALYTYSLKNILGDSLTAKPVISQPPSIQ